MNVSYKCGELREICLELDKAQAALGVSSAEDLVTVIEEIRALSYADEILACMNEIRDVCFNGKIKISFGEERAAVFAAVGDKFKMRDDGHPMWSTVTRVRLDQLEGQRKNGS